MGLDLQAEQEERFFNISFWICVYHVFIKAAASVSTEKERNLMSKTVSQADVTQRHLYKLCALLWLCDGCVVTTSHRQAYESADTS